MYLNRTAIKNKPDSKRLTPTLSADEVTGTFKVPVTSLSKSGTGLRPAPVSSRLGLEGWRVMCVPAQQELVAAPSKAECHRYAALPGCLGGCFRKTEVVRFGGAGIRQSIEKFCHSQSFILG